MKILSQREEHGMIFITTDSLVIPEFAYPADRFSSVDSLMNEMNNKITEVTAREMVNNTKKSVLMAQVTATIARDQEPILEEKP